MSGTGDRAAALRESLAGELEAARAVVQAAAAARKRAERDAERLEEEIAGLQREEQARKVCFCKLALAACTQDNLARHDHNCA